MFSKPITLIFSPLKAVLVFLFALVILYKATGNFTSKRPNGKHKGRFFSFQYLQCLDKQGIKRNRGFNVGAVAV